MGKKTASDVRVRDVAYHKATSQKKAENKKNDKPQDVSIWNKVKTWVKEKI